MHTFIFKRFKSSCSDPRDPMTYRAISLASSVYKIYCSISNDRLYKWADDNKKTGR